jgi:NAD(P)-dependent dehydrogenase (short-subunit alcohol dehydrogenase family)
MCRVRRKHAPALATHRLSPLPTAQEWGQFNIRANAIAFGLIDTRLTRPKVCGRAVAIGAPPAAAPLSACAWASLPALTCSGACTPTKTQTVVLNSSLSMRQMIN